MEPGTPLNRKHLNQISQFMEALAEVYGGALLSDLKGNTKISRLIFPNQWRGLEVILKYPHSSQYADLDFTIKSAVSEPTLFSTKDEGLAKVFLTSVIQMYEPQEERFTP